MFNHIPLLSFLRDTRSTPVSEDTVTPANSRPLPVKLMGLTGSVAINADNLNLEVQLSHTGSNPDSVRIGDGDSTAAVDPASADGTSATITGLVGLDRLYGFNGTSWDRLRSVNTGVLRVAVSDSAGADISGSNPLPVSGTFVAAGSTIGVVTNTPLALANTEYVITLPINTQKFSLRCRNKSKLQYSFSAGQSGTTYATITPGNSWDEADLLLPAPLPIYVRVSQATEVIELTYWT